MKNNQFERVMSKLTHNITEKDDLNLDIIKKFFKSAINQNLPNINTFMEEIDYIEFDKNNLDDFKRQLHTLKGSSTMMGFNVLGALIHRMEDISSLITVSQKIETNIVELIKDEYKKITYLINKYLSENYTLSNSEVEWILLNKEQSKSIILENNNNDNEVRLYYDSIDKLINKTIDLRMNKNAVEEQFNEIYSSILSFKTKYELGELNDKTELSYFLNQMLYTLTNKKNTLNNEIKKQDKNSEYILKSLLKMRIVPFSFYEKRFFNIVKSISKSEDKICQLNINSEGIEIDKELFDKLIPIIEHILRNSIIHGIESTNERIINNKKEIGLIEINTKIKGNFISIEIKDDGKGINFDKLKEKANENNISYKNEKELIDLIFQPGISTLENENNYAGRGIGLDVVKTTINSIGGDVVVESNKNVGTKFILNFPIKQAITKVFIIKQNNQFYGIPNIFIEQILSFNKNEFIEIKDKENIDIKTISGENVFVPFVNFSFLLNKKLPNENKSFFKVLILNYLNNRIALYIDELINNVEVVIQEIGKLNKTNGIIGATLLQNSRSALILNPIMMLDNYNKDLDKNNKESYVIIVDDSKPHCLIHEKFLSNHNINSVSKEDGKIAFEYLLENIENLPKILITDLEMPNMNGFELVEKVKNHELMKNIKIVMITSKNTEECKKVAYSKGVDLFLPKTNNKEDLINFVKEFI